MDNQKDNPINPEEKSVAKISKTPEPISYFEQDEAFVFVYKKTEKLATALYMVTGLFPDSEPMKWSLRGKISGLLSFMVGYKRVLDSQYSDFVDTVKTDVLEIVSMLQIASLSGQVSEMNFSIIKQEFINLTDVLDKSNPVQKESSYNSLSKSFFDVGEQGKGGNYADKVQHGFVTAGPRMSFGNVKDNQLVSDTNLVTRTNRQNVILGLLKKKKELTIKDIAHVIKDCSEKTIQRELIALISAGVLKKTGERRWSKYMMNGLPS